MRPGGRLPAGCGSLPGALTLGVPSTVQWLLRDHAAWYLDLLFHAAGELFLDVLMSFEQVFSGPCTPFGPLTGAG